MRKIFTFLAAALMSAGMFATTVTWNSSTFSSIDLFDGQSITQDGVTLTVLDGMIAGWDGNWMGNSSDASFKFSTSLGNFTRIEITGDIRELGGSGWTQTSPGAVWTGDANETTFGMYFRDVTQIVFTIEEPAPTTYTLQLVADPEKGSVAVTNLLGSDIIDNGNGNYTVPENAEVTILATPLEGYEFTGWKVGNIEEMVGCYYCGTALNTEDNPYTFTMTADVAYLAEFEATAPQPQMDKTAIYAAFPAENHPAEIEIAFINRDFTWGMEALDNKPWYASELDLMTSAEDTIKFRDKANNALILCEFIPANGNQDGRWQQMYVKMANYEVVSFKGEMVRLIEELDLRDAAKYAWMENAPEPLPAGIENIVLTEKAKKVVVDGVLYIVRDNKLFNMTGAQVK